MIKYTDILYHTLHGKTWRVTYVHRKPFIVLVYYFGWLPVAHKFFAELCPNSMILMYMIVSRSILDYGLQYYSKFCRITIIVGRIHLLLKQWLCKKIP